MNEKNMSSARGCLALLVCLLLGTITADAQSINGRIVGTVTDTNGAVIPKASVIVTNEGTGAERRLEADESGTYAVAELPVGLYAVKVEAANFAPANRPHVKVDVGAETRVDVSMSVQGLATAVTVESQEPVLQSDTSALSEVINNRQVESLPINGRDFRRLTTLTPGAAPRSQRGSLGSFTVNGQREKSNIFLIDGVDNNDSFRNQPSFNQGGVTGAPATLFPVDALGELNIQTQGAAEYGRNSGAVLNIVVKTGTNEFHGSLYEFLRNDNFDARNFFETKKNEFKNNNFGGVLGGPIIRNRTFFFTGYEGQRESVFSPFAVRVPSAADIAAARASNVAAGRAENPLSTRILALFPAESNTATTGNNYLFGAPNSNRSNNFLAKIDHRVTSKLNLSGRYIFGQGTQVFPLTSGNGSPLPSYQTVVPTRIQLVGLNLPYLISSTLINETRLSYNRFTQAFAPLDAGFDPSSIGLNTGLTSGGLPTITVTGFVPLGSPNNLPRSRVSSAYQVVDNVTWTNGAHTYKFGGEYRRPLVNSVNDTFKRGQINFTSLANFLAGSPSPGSTVILRGGTRRDTFSHNVGLFAQDDWKVNQRLTLNLGLRYEYAGVFADAHKQISNFVPGVGLVQVGNPALPRLYNRDRNNFAPRLGFAYDLTGKSKTILRAAYGIYYDAPSQDFFLAHSFQNGGPGSVGNNFLPAIGTFNVTFPSTATVPFGSGVPIFPGTTAPPTPFPIFAVDLNQRTPYVQSYNVNLQHSLSDATVLQVSYVGSQGRKLYRVRDINQARPGAGSAQSRRPFNAQFPQYSFINYFETSANSNYNALQTYLRQRMSSGLTLFVSYTWSKSIDDASNGIYGGTRGVSLPQDSYNTRAERALSSFDVRHRLTANFVYDLKFLPHRLDGLPKRLTEGWQLSGILTSASGIPITPFISTDVSLTGELNDRPNVIGDIYAGGHTVSAWVNPCVLSAAGVRLSSCRPGDTPAWQIPAVGTFGNAGRNIVIGPRFNVFDFSVNKSTRINERVSLQFRSEFFNIFNHPNFALPNVQVNASSFGAIGNTPDVDAGNPRLGDGGPRVIQFGLKLLF
ncbi:MAG: TonB-dependent receptor [Acidobacteria bacterium]|nr:TonB-dependent receptor [Acidobacteriota bacterium]